VALIYPPHHKLFDSISPIILVHQSCQQNAAAPATSAAPVINLTLGHNILGLTHPPILPQDSILNTSSSSTEMLLNAGCNTGIDCLVTEFCQEYDLTKNLQKKLSDNGYTKARMFRFICISELKDMSFLNGEIATLKDAVEQWSTAA
jgi:hypothetical protein